MGEGRFEVVGVPDELQEGGGGLVVLTFCLLISNPFLSSFSAHQPPLSSHLHPIVPQVGGALVVFIHGRLWLRDEEENVQVKSI